MIINGLRTGLVASRQGPYTTVIPENLVFDLCDEITQISSDPHVDISSTFAIVRRILLCWNSRMSHPESEPRNDGTTFLRRAQNYLRHVTDPNYTSIFELSARGFHLSFTFPGSRRIVMEFQMQRSHRRENRRYIRLEQLLLWGIPSSMFPLTEKASISRSCNNKDGLNLYCVRSGASPISFCLSYS
jgi:hypothetical protein